MSERAFEVAVSPSNAPGEKNAGQAEKNQAVLEDLARASAAVENHREARRVYTAVSHTPGLTESGIAPDVLTGLLPDEGVVELPRVKRVSGSLGYRFVKRAFDLCACSAALVVLAIPMAVIAVKIRQESPGPAIYAQRRVGLNGKVFNLYKFRSMYQDAEVRGAQWAKDEDPRVTPLGRFLRNKRLAPVIIGTPGDGEPTKSFSHPENSSLDLQKCERRPGTSLGARHHYTNFQFLSFAVFGGPEGASGRPSHARSRASFASVGAVA